MDDHIHEPYDAQTHEWLDEPRCPCSVCGVLWPGYELPDPIPDQNPGYGELAKLPSWRTRVNRMVHELEEVA